MACALLTLAALAHAQTVFRVTTIPEEAATEQVRKFAPIASYLEKRLGMKVEFTPVSDYPAAVEALVNKKVDLAWLGGFTYVQAQIRSGGKIVPIAQRVEDTNFQSVFIAKTASGIKSLADLKGKQISFGSQSSTSGHLMPRHYLLQAGIDPEKDFKRVAYSGAHDATIASVVSGKVQAAALDITVWKKFVGENRVDTKAVDVFFTTPAYSNYNWSVHADMPADLRAHLRYPDDIYRIQTSLYTTYHMDAPEDFYHREDQWQIPQVTKADESVPFMRHIIMRLPEESKAEFIYMVPFTPRGKENLAAWMVARNDGDVYGKLLVYRLSRQSLVFGPRQIENRINQNTEIARQVSLWDQRGSRVIRGDLLVIPIEESLVYVQPLYLQAEGGRIPELKRVIVAYQNRVVMQETWEAGLTELFGGATGAQREPAAVAGGAGTAGTAGAGASDTTIPALVAEAWRRYQAALEANRQVDWTRYGEEFRRLGEVLERLRTPE